MSDRVIVHVATFPEREANIRKVVEDLRPQCHELNVYWNGYTEVPAWAERLGVTWDTPTDDLGDAGKFYSHDEAPAYHLTVDDDLFYPPNYVARIVEAIEELERKAVVSFHGKVLNPNTWPWKSYYNGRAIATLFRCLGDEKLSRWLTLPGSGVFGYHSDTCRLELDDFRRHWPNGRNMADIHLGVRLKELGVPILGLAHVAGWIVHQPIDYSRTIYMWERDNDYWQTKTLNDAGPWDWPAGGE